jgi:hypothetical protein
MNELYTEPLAWWTRKILRPLVLWLLYSHICVALLAWANAFGEG